MSTFPGLVRYSAISGAILLITTLVHRILHLFEPVILRCFHVLFYMDRRTWSTTTWLGVPCLKNPLDAWIYQEILYQNGPDVLIECGTNRGGSAYFMRVCLT